MKMRIWITFDVCIAMHKYENKKLSEQYLLRISSLNAGCLTFELHKYKH